MSMCKVSYELSHFLRHCEWSSGNKWPDINKQLSHTHTPYQVSFIPYERFIYSKAISFATAGLHYCSTAGSLQEFITPGTTHTRMHFCIHTYTHTCIHTHVPPAFIYIATQQADMEYIITDWDTHCWVSRASSWWHKQTRALTYFQTDEC